MLSLQELRSSTLKELTTELLNARKQKTQLHLTLRSKHEKNSSLSKKSGRYIARILTIMRAVREEENQQNKKPVNQKERLSNVS
jgi:ribosomal protein L29